MRNTKNENEKVIFEKLSGTLPDFQEIDVVGGGAGEEVGLFILSMPNCQICNRLRLCLILVCSTRVERWQSSKEVHASRQYYTPGDHLSTGLRKQNGGRTCDCHMGKTSVLGEETVPVESESP